MFATIIIVQIQKTLTSRTTTDFMRNITETVQGSFQPSNRSTYKRILQPREAGSSEILEDGHLTITSVDDCGGVSVKRFCVWVECSASASDVLLSRVEGHLVVDMRLHHVIGGSGNPAMMWGVQPRLGGRHPVSGSD